MFTLLIADSSRQACDELAAYCKQYNNITTLPSVQNGKDAMDTLRANTVQILLMDILLPILDGLSILNMLQEWAEDRRPTVFVHTAFLDNRLLYELQRLRVAYCFVKPMEPEHIIPRIMQLMRTADEMDVINSNALEAIDFADDLSKEITRQIRAVGVPAHLRGYHYLRTAIQCSVEAKEPSVIAITKDIYPYIAKMYGTQSALVERSIRNAIEVAWTRGRTKELDQYFGYTIDDSRGKPTNSEFIAMIADRVRMQRR